MNRAVNLPSGDGRRWCVLLTIGYLETSKHLQKGIDQHM